MVARMSALAAAWLATPLFGLALTPPAGMDVSVDPQIAAVVAAQAAATGATDDDADDSATAGDEEGGGSDGGATAAEEELNRALRSRADFIRIKRPLGIAAWASMTVTMALGTLRYINRFGGGWSDTPCTNDGAVFGVWGCTGGLLYAHLGSALLTSALYYTTGALAIAMPDPENASEGNSDYARTLRLHKVLAWVHFFGMIAQSALGFLVSNLGFNIANEDEYDTARMLATVHLGIGFVTYGAFTWAAALEVF